jgi:hypothetical protein
VHLRCGGERNADAIWNVQRYDVKYENITNTPLMSQGTKKIDKALYRNTVVQSSNHFCG